MVNFQKKSEILRKKSEIFRKKQKNNKKKKGAKFEKKNTKSRMRGKSVKEPPGEIINISSVLVKFQ